MDHYPDPDTALYRLQLAGWSIGETASGSTWLVTGVNGENAIIARGRTQAEAWAEACREAERLGMFGRSFY